MAIKSIFQKFKKGFDVTRTALSRNIKSIFSSERPWTEEDYEALEEVLIRSDLGTKYAIRFIDDIRERYRTGKIKTAEDIIEIARADVIDRLSVDHNAINFNPAGPTVILMVGVNGSGKTTTSGKLGKLFSDDGKKVMFAACDTFRAAAIDQLKIWGERVDCKVIHGKPNGDAAAVAFDACKSAVANDIDVLIIDTAGRQHTKKNLMDELAKVQRIIDKALPGAPHETWLVVDGSTGTNGLMQAKEFSKATPLTGLCLTKLDGTGKGGIVVAIHEEMNLPVRFVGLGEAADDLQPFNADHFAEAVFPKDLV